jgi:hypothetical protein
MEKKKSLGLDLWAYVNTVMNSVSNKRRQIPWTTNGFSSRELYSQWEMGGACSTHGIKVTLIYSFGRKPSKTIDRLENKQERTILNYITKKRDVKERTEPSRTAYAKYRVLAKGSYKLSWSIKHVILLAKVNTYEDFQGLQVRASSYIQLNQATRCSNFSRLLLVI